MGGGESRQSVNSCGVRCRYWYCMHGYGSSDTHRQPRTRRLSVLPEECIMQNLFFRLDCSIQMHLGNLAMARRRPRKPWRNHRASRPDWRPLEYIFYNETSWTDGGPLDWIGWYCNWWNTMLMLSSSKVWITFLHDFSHRTIESILMKWSVQSKRLSSTW